MRKSLILTMLVLSLIAMPSILLANDVGYIRSVPNVIVDEQIYRVNIQRINGKNPITSHRYTVDAGVATIRVSLILDAQWAPKLKMIQDDIFDQEFKMHIESGTTYVIGAKVNPDASKEEQEAGIFWTPTIVEKTTDE